MNLKSIISISGVWNYLCLACDKKRTVKRTGYIDDFKRERKSWLSVIVIMIMLLLFLNRFRFVFVLF